MAKETCIVMAQLKLLVGDLEGNTTKLIAAAQEASQRDQARLIVFSELAVTAYPPEDLLLHQNFLKQVDIQIERLCQATQDIGIIVGAPRQHAGHLYNAALYLEDGKIQAEHFKTELPNYSVFDEKRYFTAGLEPCVIDIDGLHIAIAICEDLWQPNVVQQLQSNHAVDIVVHINASPFYMDKSERRLEALRACTAKLHKPILYVNQVGGQDELVFDGSSCVLDADGQLLWRAPSFQEGLYPCSVALKDSKVSFNRLPSEEHSPQHRSQEAMVWQALCLGLSDYIEKNKFAGVVIGLSGGIDSALTLALAVDALGNDRVTAVMLPSRYTSDMSLEDSNTLTATLGVKLIDLPIDGCFDMMLKQLEVIFGDATADVTEENLQARIRGVFLMALSNKFNWAVLATGNKSEFALGYATLYGDMVGAFAPIKDVTKTLVYRLARHYNCVGGKIPQRILTRPPSAELAPNQLDEDTLPPYALLDPIVEYFMQNRACPDTSTQEFDAKLVEQITHRMLQYEYKRRQSPLGIKITDNAFGKDWRYLISANYTDI